MEYDYMNCAAKRVSEEGLPTCDGGVEALIERLERATGDAPALNEEMARLDGWVQPANNGGSWAKDYGDGKVRWMFNAPNYTGSVDAAVTLIPAGWSLTLWGEGADWSAYLCDRDEQHPNVKVCRADDCHNPAIAVCLAAIRAMREPTFDMVQCGHGAGWHGGIEGDKPCEEEAAGILWKKMIEAASPEGK